MPVGGTEFPARQKNWYAGWTPKEKGMFDVGYMSKTNSLEFLLSRPMNWNG